MSDDGEAEDRMLGKAQEVGKVFCELPTPHREIQTLGPIPVKFGFTQTVIGLVVFVLGGLHREGA